MPKKSIKFEANEIEQMMKSQGWAILIDELKLIINDMKEELGAGDYIVTKEGVVHSKTELAKDLLFRWLEATKGKIQIRDFSSEVVSETLELYKIKQ